MFQLNKRTIVFLAVFSVILLAITICAIIYTNTHDTSDFSQIIIEESNKTEDETKNKLVDDGVGGLNLSDKYNVNDLEITNIEYESSENSKLNIRYCQISGLNNEVVEEKINNEIKNIVFNIYTQFEINDASIKDINVYANCIANFSDVLSIEISKFIVYTNNDTKNVYDGLNYKLDTGDKISFNDLFTYNTGKKNIISEVAYKQLAWNYYYGDSDGICNMDRIDYSELEEDVYRILNNYSSDENLKFYFSEKYISLIVNNIVIDIPMSNYYENIAIYNRFKSDENLYKENYYQLENIPVLMKVYNGNFSLYYEDDYCTVIMRVDNFSDNDIIEKYKQEIYSKIDEIKKEAEETGKGIYYEGILSTSDKDNEVEIYEQYHKYSSSKENYKKYVSDKIIEEERNSKENDAAWLPYDLDERYVTIEENYVLKKKYDKNTKKEINDDDGLEETENESDVEEYNTENNNTNEIVNNSNVENNITNGVTNGVNNTTNVVENNSLDTVITVD